MICRLPHLSVRGHLVRKAHASPRSMAVIHAEQALKIQGQGEGQGQWVLVAYRSPVITFDFIRTHPPCTRPMFIHQPARQSVSNTPALADGFLSGCTKSDFCRYARLISAKVDKRVTPRAVYGLPAGEGIQGGG